MSDVIIALTGKRQVGKSTISNYLVEHYGFQRLHPFNGGKAACRAYYAHLGADEQTAWRMTDGDLKDKPSPILPIIQNPDHGQVGQHYDSRFFMETFGQFLGVNVGPDWTAGAELKLMRERNSGQPLRIIAESIVYEEAVLRREGAFVIEVRAIGADHQAVKGLMTDAAMASIIPDMVIDNIFSHDPADREALFDRIDGVLDQQFGIRTVEPEFASM